MKKIIDIYLFNNSFHLVLSDYWFGFGIDPLGGWPSFKIGYLWISFMNWKIKK